MIKSAQKKIFKGFTLIELLIVIAILGILAAAVLVAINPAKRTRQARDAARKNDIGSLATEIQAYYTTPGQGLYPVNSGCGTTGNGLTTLTSSGGLKQVPNDPTAGRNYCYVVSGAGANATEAAVYATLEDATSAGGGINTHYWCWRSSNNLATEVIVGSGCSAP